MLKLSHITLEDLSVNPEKGNKMAIKRSTIIIIIIFLLGMAFLTSCQGSKNSDEDPTEQMGKAFITVKFSQGTDIRLRDGQLVSLSQEQIPELTRLFEEIPVLSIDRGFSQPEDEIESERAQLIKEGHEDVPDLNLYFVLTVADQDIAARLIDELAKLDIVEFAEFAPEPAPLPVPLP